MDSNSDDFILEEDDGLEARSPSHNSVPTNSGSLSLGESSTFRQSSSVSPDSVSEETYAKQLDDRVRELKAELQTRCHVNLFTKFEPAQHNPKIELNLLLHSAIHERTLKQLALSKGIHFRNDEQIFADIFQVHIR